MPRLLHGNLGPIFTQGKTIPKQPSEIVSSGMNGPELRTHRTTKGEVQHGILFFVNVF